ncbi:MAG: oligosaccharide flippase family protein [Candidatus Omnitrophica bacterium]|nr:oligosaccharide flippase family protein [Candidatus Omnitrophota bacterium]
MSKKKEILQDVGLYSFAVQVTQLVTTITAILMRNVLGPFQMGIWATLQIVLDYSKYTTLGTSNATTREIPYYLGKKDGRDMAVEIGNQVASFWAITALLTAMGVLVYAYLFRAKLPAVLCWGLVFISVIVILQRLNNLLINMLRAYKQFALNSYQTILSAIVNLALVAALGYKFKFYGVMWAMVLSFVFNSMFILLCYRFNFKFVLNKRLLDLIAYGFPLMFLEIGSSLLRSVDKIIIIKMLGFEAMGFYSVPVMATVFLTKIPDSMVTVMAPHFHGKFGERDNIKDLKGYVDQATFAYYSFMPLIIGISWIITPLFVALVLPEYTRSIFAVKCLILGTFFMALSNPYHMFIIVIKKYMSLFPIMAAIIGLAVGGVVLAITLGFGIGGVAAVMVFISFLNFLFYYVLAGKFLYSFSESVHMLKHILLRFVFMLALLVCLDVFVRFGTPLLQTSIQLFIFLLANIPFLYMLNKKFEILRHMSPNFGNKGKGSNAGVGELPAEAEREQETCLR